MSSATIAPTERDDEDIPPSPSSSEERHPRNTNRTTIVREDRPLFAFRTHSGGPGLFGGRGGGGGGDASSLISRSGSGNWMGSGKANRGMKLGEAFQRTNENGDFKPRPRPMEKEGSSSESRIPRAKTFSPVSGKPLSPSPSKGLKGSHLNGRGGRVASGPAEYGTAEKGTGDESPSPGPRHRRWSKSGSGSDVSSIGLVEDPTNDDFDRKMRQFARDQKRITGVLSSRKGLFSRADVGPKVAETTRTLARKTSTSSLESEPPLRVPRTWGSKAKKNGDWMARILSPDTSLGVMEHVEEPATSEGPQTAADIPLPSVEDRSSIQEPTPPASRPASAQLNSLSPEKSKMWDADLDFTAQSLQISTSPQLRVKTKKLDDIRNREIQNLTARAVATNRLEEIRERNSEERSVSFEPARTNSKVLLGKEVEGPAAYEPFHDKTILEEEGEHIRGTPITVFSAGSYDSRRNSSSQERTSNHDRERSSEQRREDSREILRRLSRASSASPGPTKPEGKRERKSVKTLLLAQPEEREIFPAKSFGVVQPEQKVDENLIKADLASSASEQVEKLAEKQLEKTSKGSGLDVDVNRKRHSATSTPPKSDFDPEERITGEARLFELQDNKSERNSIRAPSRSPSPSGDGFYDKTPISKADPLSLRTPKVTGAYIETPAPCTRKPRKSRSTSPSFAVVDVDVDVEGDGKDGKRNNEISGPAAKDQAICQSRSISSLRESREPHPQITKHRTSRPQSRPPLINTANPTTAAEDLRRIQRETQLEDSTLDGFDALLEPNASATPEIKNTTILEPVVDLEYNEHGIPLTKKEIERRREKLRFDRMSQSLKNTSTSIRDARHGIERLEHQVSSSPLPPNSKPDEPLYFKIPVPRLWISYPRDRPDMKPRWKFTWLGFILSSFLAWYISESAMCAQFCHPVQSTANTWQPSDPFFPWAIPTKLDQWTGEIVSTTASSLWDSVLAFENHDSRQNYKGGPLGSSDWWLGRDGPVGIVRDDESSGGGGAASIFSDEMI